MPAHPPMTFPSTASAAHARGEGNSGSRRRRVPWRVIVSPAILLSLFGLCVWLNVLLTRQIAPAETVRDELVVLPRGEVVRSLALGFNQVVADVLWLKVVQVLGQPNVSVSDYEWLAHALDVITTVDPQFVSAYDIGGTALAELAGRADWSNALLEKGIAANPQVWRLPFQMGFNLFFHQHEYVRAAEYMARAATLPGRPAYVPELAARLYVEAQQPATALQFLNVMAAQTQDHAVLTVLERRRREVMIERDVALLDRAVDLYRTQTGRHPSSLHELVQSRLIPAIPAEPFGGTYLYDLDRERVISSTHPQRMHLYQAPDETLAQLPEASVNVVGRGTSASAAY